MGDGSEPGVDRGSGAACSKAASNAFIPGRRASAIAARTAGRRRGSGRVGRPSNDTGRRLPARRNATGKAGVTGSARKPGKRSDPEAVKRAARVITPENFFRSFAATGRGATSDSRQSGEVPCSAFVRRPAGARWSGLRSGSGAGNRRAFNLEILILRQCWPYIQPVDATGVSPTRPALGALASAPPGAAAAAVGVAGGGGPANTHRGGGRPSGSFRGHRRL